MPPPVQASKTSRVVFIPGERVHLCQQVVLVLWALVMKITFTNVSLVQSTEDTCSRTILITLKIKGGLWSGVVNMLIRRVSLTLVKFTFASIPSVIVQW